MSESLTTLSVRGTLDRMVVQLNGMPIDRNVLRDVKIKRKRTARQLKAPEPPAPRQVPPPRNRRGTTYRFRVDDVWARVCVTPPECLMPVPALPARIGLRDLRSQTGGVGDPRRTQDGAEGDFRKRVPADS